MCLDWPFGRFGDGCCHRRSSGEVQDASSPVSSAIEDAGKESVQMNVMIGMAGTTRGNLKVLYLGRLRNVPAIDVTILLQLSYVTASVAKQNFRDAQFI